MKTKIYFFLLLCFVSLTNLYSQSYDSLVVTTKIWSNVTGSYGADMKEHRNRTTFVKFAVDTAINTIEEKQVIVSNDSLKTWTKVGNIKEVEQKIYFRNLENEQGLLYDFSAKVGDTINTVNKFVEFRDSIAFKIINIDTVEYFGIDRKRLEVYDILYGCTDYWIEGIGSEYGLLRPIFCVTGGFSKLLCVYQQSTQIYQNPQRNTCYEFDSETGLKDVDKLNIQVYPNPTSGKIILEGTEGIQNLNMTVYNVVGTLISRQNIITNEVQLNLQKGIYILTLKVKDNFIHKQIITIN